MLELGLVLIFGLALLPTFAALRGQRRSAFFYWGSAGLILWGTGLALTLGQESRSLIIAAHAAGPLSASLILHGARRFARRPASSRVPWLGAIGAALTGLAFALVGRGAAVGVEMLFSWPMLIASAGMVIENAWRTRAALPEKALGGALVCLALLMPIDLVSRTFVQADWLLLPAWATLAFTIAFLTVAAGSHRSARRARRLTRRLEERTEALEVERQSLVALVESSPIGIALTDPPGAIRYLNARGAEILGIAPPEAWQGRHAAEIAEAIAARLGPDSQGRLAAVVGSRFSERAIAPRVELDLDEGAQIVELTSHPVRGEDDRCLGRLWMCRDVTEERRFSERLVQAQRMETVGTLAGGIAHDFNNQLTAILGNIDILLLNASEDDPRLRAVEAVEQSALHCAELTHGLLTFSKRRPPSAESVSVEKIVQDVVALLRPGLAPDARLEANVAPDTGAILADGDDLLRVLMNLGVNARDAVAESGVIRIEARRVGPPEAAQVELVVSDDGVGMDDATRRRIFDPFFTTKDPGRGTGLGLSVTYGIVENHGATIEVESAPGSGTTFRLMWPAASIQASVEGGESSDSVEPAPLTGATVLLAEDDALVRDSAREMLERAGCRVIEAVDGPSAVSCFKARRSEVDLLLLDLAMPGYSGLAALNEISELAPDLPAILMSGNPDPFADQMPDGSEILLKPFRTLDLAARVSAVLSRESRA